MQELLYRFGPSKKIPEIIRILREKTHGMIEPMSFSIVALYGRDPFLILVSCLLSSRTKDSVVLPASLRLFEVAKTPEQLKKISLIHIEKLIFPIGFYRNKAKHLHKLCDQLLSNYGGKVPESFMELMQLSGVGPKTANLVLGVGFGKPALCVDTHVHRICNRLGLVNTKNPLETERALQLIVPKEDWIELNRLLVMWGQNVCTPFLPYCSRCALSSLCLKKEVTKNR